MEGHDQSLHTGQQGLQRGGGVSGPRSAAGRVANQQTGGDSLVDTLFEGLQEQSRLKIMRELRRFSEVANHSGDLEKYSEAINVVKPKLNKDIREMGGRVDPGKR